jgi:hypothetical protein
MTVDAEGYLYVATSYGIQICDQAGRVNAIIAKPQPGPLTNVPAIVPASPLSSGLCFFVDEEPARAPACRQGWRPHVGG